MADTTLTSDKRIDEDHAIRKDVTALVLAWCAAEPDRIGEVAFFSDDGPMRILGRGAAQPDDDAPRTQFFRQRPGRSDPTEPLEGPGLSRRQLLITPRRGELFIKQVGRCPLFVSGREVSESVVKPGDTVHLQNQIILYCTRRPAHLPSFANYPADACGEHGAADRFGIVGESAVMWEVREKLAFIATRAQHVLILGESGTGKELFANAIHLLSPRGDRAIIARNAATFPAGLIDAELFGNVRDYPNPGMRERPGLFGEADGGTLFLDEIGELPEEMQAHLLRALDGGEYQRLGDSRSRRADVRLLAATNRPTDALKHDFLARLPLRITLPSLNDRREDVPLLVRHWLLCAAASDREIGRRFLSDWNETTGNAKLEPELVDRLLRHEYTHHMRELSGLILRAMSESSGGTIRLGSELRDTSSVSAKTYRDPQELTPEVIQAALDEHEGNQARAWQSLGLKNRDALYRLIKKYNLVVPGRS